MLSLGRRSATKMIPIFEGTSEIQRMIIGRAVTGLDVPLAAGPAMPSSARSGHAFMNGESSLSGFFVRATWAAVRGWGGPCRTGAGRSGGVISSRR